MEKFKAYSCNWTNGFVTSLFLAVAPKLLALRFDGIEDGRRNTATFYSFSITLAEGVETYRRIIWEILSLLCLESKNQPLIYNLLKNYGRSIDESSRAVVNADAPHIVSIMELAYPTSYLSNCLLAERLTDIFSTDETTFHLLDEYLNAPKLTLYRLMKGPRHSLEIHYHEREIAKKDAIDKYVQRCSAAEFNELIDTCKECVEYDGDNSYEIANGLELAFHAFSSKGECFIKAVRYYIKSNMPFDINPQPILKDLFLIMAPSEILELINSEEYTSKNAWLYAYYHEIPTDVIDDLQLQGLYSYLHSDSDVLLTRSSYRDVDFLEKYRKVDANVLIKASRIILSKVRYSRFIPHLYFSLLFNEYRNTPESVVKKYESDLELLEDIYIESISYSQHDDHDGKFLKEIYQTSPTILDKFISKILCSTNRPHFDEYREKSLAFFALNNADQVFDTIVDSLIASAQYALYDVSDFIESIVTPKQNNDELAQKQDHWIRHFIIGNFADKDKMEYLFYGIAELPTERKVSYIKLLLEHNESYEIFESLPLFPMITSWTNSAVPHLTSRIKYMEQILPNLSGLKFIKHKKRIENIIDGLREEIRQEEIRDILDS